MRRAWILTLAAPAPAALAGVGKNRVRYPGGVWTGVQEGAEGTVRIEDSAAVFTWAGRANRLPFKQITSLDYGRKVGRRIGATIGWGATALGPAALPMLLSKKRRHLATIGYRDEESKPQGLVLEFGKEINRSAMKMLSLKSGKEVEFESEQAQKEFYH